VVEESQFKTLSARIVIARAYNAQAKGEVSATVKYAEEALRLIPEENQFMRAQSTAILAGAHWANGELSAGFDAMNTWMEQARRSGNVVFAIMTAHGLADILTAQGRLRDAVKMYSDSLQFAASVGMENTPFTAHHHLGLAMLFHEMNDGAMDDHLQKGLALGQGSTIVDWAYRRNLAQARLKETYGEFDAALEFLEEAKRVYVKTPIPLTHPVEAFKVRIFLKQGQFAKAQAWASQFSVDDELSYLHEFEHVTFARVLIAEYQARKTKSLQDALQLLERLLQAAEDGKRTGSVIEILILQALAMHVLGNTPKALASLQHALTLAEPEGYIRIFNEGKPLTELLLKLNDTLENAVQKNYLQKILSVIDAPIHRQSNSQSLIDPLSERELEVLRLVAQGLSNTAISEKLFLSLSTIKGHNLRIFNKLLVKSRTEAIVRARELGLL